MEIFLTFFVLFLMIAGFLVAWWSIIGSDEEIDEWRYKNDKR